MAEQSYPFDSADLTQDQWSRMARQFIGIRALSLGDGGGIYGDPGTTDLKATGDSGGMRVLVAAGEANIRGHHYRNTAQLVLPVGNNSSGQTRYDRVVLRLDLTAKQITAVVVPGTPSAPSLTQSDAGTWEESLGVVTVANNAVTIAPGNVSDERIFLGELIRSRAFPVGAGSLDVAAPRDGLGFARFLDGTLDWYHDAGWSPLTEHGSGPAGTLAIASASASAALSSTPTAIGTSGTIPLKANVPYRVTVFVPHFSVVNSGETVALNIRYDSSTLLHQERLICYPSMSGGGTSIRAETLYQIGSAGNHSFQAELLTSSGNGTLNPGGSSSPGYAYWLRVDEIGV